MAWRPLTDTYPRPIRAHLRYCPPGSQTATPQARMWRSDCTDRLRYRKAAAGAHRRNDSAATEGGDGKGDIVD